MLNINSSPWDFTNTFETPSLSKESFKVTYDNLLEIAMGAPLHGRCFLETANEKMLINNWCGGPAIWDTEGHRIAVPIWSRKFFKGTFQQIGVVDSKSMTLTVFSKIFRVLEFSSFEKNIIYGCDSPIYKPTSLTFDIEKEKVKTEIDLKVI